MALHGRIDVNGQPIGSWSARRTTPGPDADGAAVYDCHVVMFGDDPPRAESFRLTHVIADGALALAARVLTNAQRLRGLPARQSPVPDATKSGGMVQRHSPAGPKAGER